MKPRLLLADDHELMVAGLRKLLEPEFKVVASVADGRAAVTAYKRLKPDLLLMDIGLPLLNGIEAARQIKQAAPDARILFVSMQTDRIYVEEAMQAGASGYIVKQAAARELVEAIHAVLDGRTYLGSKITERGRGQEDGTRFRGHLTARQREVLQLIAEGKTMKEIASILRISVRTVEFHRNGLTEQLALHSTAELTRYAVGLGIAMDMKKWPGFRRTADRVSALPPFLADARFKPSPR